MIQGEEKQTPLFESGKAISQTTWTMMYYTLHLWKHISATDTLMKSTIMHINIDKSLHCYADLKEPDTKEYTERARKRLQEL